MLWKLPNITQIKPETIFYIGGFPVSNTLLCTWISILILALVFFTATRYKSLVPTRYQSAVEMAVEYMRGLVESVSGKVKGRKFFPLVAALFLFIVVSNMLDILPGVDTIGAIDGAGIQSLHLSAATCNQQFLGFLPNCQPVAGFLLFGQISNQITPWIRPNTSDLNLTLSMALVAVITCQVFGFATLGAKEHLNKYINVRALKKLNFEGFIEFFVGILEIVSELSRIISFSFRLFGNIFAGSAVLAVFAFILPFVADIAFIPLEMFVAVVQALVFALLTLVFLEIATTGHGSHDSESEHEARAEYAHNEQQQAQTQTAAAR
ncbi:MAG TPA: F0F1 ATP synthase subunit A [Ktedonobacteraceae bacterium]|nr:F0F1 ATP synthase subunit A [Ktedonobacteraceae bacterium]